MARCKEMGYELRLQSTRTRRAFFRARCLPPQRTSIMHHLPLELKDLVLEHIPSEVDLQALCLTNIAIHAAATPYRTVCIRIWMRNGTARFVHSVVVGAGRHLRHTRSLTFGDVKLPSESKIAKNRRSDYDGKALKRANRKAVIGGGMLLVLEMFPDDCLHTFRFIRPLEMDTTYHHVRSANF